MRVLRAARLIACVIPLLCSPPEALQPAGHVQKRARSDDAVTLQGGAERNLFTRISPPPTHSHPADQLTHVHTNHTNALESCMHARTTALPHARRLSVRPTGDPQRVFAVPVQRGGPVAAQGRRLVRKLRASDRHDGSLILRWPFPLLLRGHRRPEISQHMGMGNARRRETATGKKKNERAFAVFFPSAPVVGEFSSSLFVELCRWYFC